MRVDTLRWQKQGDCGDIVRPPAPVGKIDHLPIDHLAQRHAEVLLWRSDTTYTKITA